MITDCWFSKECSGGQTVKINESLSCWIHEPGKNRRNCRTMKRHLSQNEIPMPLQNSFVTATPSVYRSNYGCSLQLPPLMGIAYNGGFWYTISEIWYKKGQSNLEIFWVYKRRVRYNRKNDYLVSMTCFCSWNVPFTKRSAHMGRDVKVYFR